MKFHAKFLAVLFSALVSVSSASAQWTGVFNPIMAANSCTQGGNDTFTKSLLHLDGSFSDTNAGGSLNTWSTTSGFVANGTPKFGSASGNTSNSSDLSTTATSGMNPGSGNFTLDGWIRRATNGTVTYLSFLGGGFPGSFSDFSYGLFIDNNNHLNGIVSSDGTTLTIITGGTTFTTATFHHVALVRSGNTVTIYLDGNSQATTAFASAIHLSTSVLEIGSGTTFGGGSAVLIDEFRLSIGVARWTTNFTPPTAPYCP